MKDLARMSEQMLRECPRRIGGSSQSRLIGRYAVEWPRGLGPRSLSICSLCCDRYLACLTSPYNLCSIQLHVIDLSHDLLLQQLLTLYLQVHQRPVCLQLVPCCIYVYLELDLKRLLPH